MRVSSSQTSTVKNNNRSTTEENRKKVSEAAVGTSAAAAVGNKAGFKMFKSAKKVSYMQSEVVDSIRFAQKPIKETKSLFGKFGKIAKGFADGITDWVRKAPVLGKIVKNKIFLGSVSFIGFGLAVLTMITGLTNIVKASTITYDNHLKNSKFFNSFDDDEDNRDKAKKTK